MRFSRISYQRKIRTYDQSSAVILGIITNPEVFYCPAQPLESTAFGIPYRYEAYTNKGGYEWGTYYYNAIWRRIILLLKSEARKPKSSTGHLTVETNQKFKTQMTETSIAANPVRLFSILDFGHLYLFRVSTFGFRI